MNRTAASYASLFVTITLLLLVTPNRADAQISERRIEVVKGIYITYPENWSASAVKYRNAIELVTPPAEKLETGLARARTLITTERRTDHAEAVRRLAEIAREVDSPPTILQIHGWPALERRYLAPLPRPGEPTDSQEEQLAPRVTTAIAAGDLLLRLETSLAPDADPKLADEALAMGRTATFPSRGRPEETEKEIETFRKSALKPTRRVPGPDLLSIGLKAAPEKLIHSRVAPGAAVAVQPGNGELEVAVSSNGQNVVVGANSGYSFSNNGGTTFTFGGGTPALFPSDGDPSLAFGVGGAFYYGFIGFPNGTPAANNVTGCSTGISRSTNNGQTFTFVNHATLCPQSGAGVCFPDQEHIAADRVNAAAGGDQVYSVWRNFVPASGPGVTCNPNTVSSWLSETPSIVCSQNGGTSWTAPAVVASGDFPRVSVGSDGFVYVVYRAGANIMLNKFSSCSAGLAQQVGFPVTVSAVTDVACPVAGLDRCNQSAGNVLSSHTVAVDDTTPNHIYVAYATNTAAGNENILVRDSNSGGSTWSAPVTVNPSTTARRFMPWVCSVGGAAFVSWYDRRAVTAANPDFTDYYVGSAVVKASALQGGPDLNLTRNPDPQCATGFPCGAGSSTDYTACSVAVGPVPGGCPKYGDYNGNACASSRIYSAWASATSPSGLPPGTGIRIFSSTLAKSDFYVRDWTDNPGSGDNGAEPSTHPVFYTTSDVWNRRGTLPGSFPNDQPENFDAGNGTGNIGDNWAFARIRRNSSPATGSNVVTAHFLVSKLGTGSNYADAGGSVVDPDVSFPDPDPTVTFDAGDLGPTTTAAYHWHLNAVNSIHLCLAVEIASVGDPYIAPSLSGFAPGWPTTDMKIINDNNKAQRNMGLSTTPATGAGAGASFSFYAIAHNAATYPRDMALRLEVAPDVVERLKNIRVELIGSEPRPFKSGEMLKLENMQPGENRWVGLTLDVPQGHDGKILPVHFFEVVENTFINGFDIAIQPSPMARVAHDSLELYRSVFTRLAAGFKVPGAQEEAAAAQAALRKKELSGKEYLAFLRAHLRFMDRSLRELIESQRAGDPFRVAQGLKTLRAALDGRKLERAAVAHTTLLNKLDSFLTMLQLSKGDTADILQNVRWQADLYVNLKPATKLECSDALLENSREFVRAYGERKIGNKEYPAFIRGLLGCFRETAKVFAYTEPDLEKNVAEIERSLGDPTALQKAHRGFLLKLQSLVK